MMELEGLISVDSGEPTILDISQHTTWLVFITQESLDRAFDLLQQVQDKALDHQVYAVEAQGQELDLDILGPLLYRAFYLNDESILETYGVESIPWYLSFKNGNLVYSSDEVPIIPSNNKSSKQAMQTVISNSKEDRDKKRLTDEHAHNGRKKEIDHGKEGNHLDYHRNGEINQENKRKETVKNRSPEPKRQDKTNESKPKIQNKSSPMKQPMNYAPKQRSPETKPVSTFVSKEKETGKQPVTTQKNPDPEVRLLKQKVQTYETRLQEYQNQVDTLIERLGQKDREIETLQTLLENKRGRKNTQSELPKRSPGNAPDNDFWQFPDEATAEKRMNFDEIAQHRNLWIASLEHHPKAPARSNEKSNQAKLNLEKQRLEHIYKTSKKSSDDGIFPRIPEKYHRSVRK